MMIRERYKKMSFFIVALIAILYLFVCAQEECSSKEMPVESADELVTKVMKTPEVATETEPTLAQPLVKMKEAGQFPYSRLGGEYFPTTDELDIRVRIIPKVATETESTLAQPLVEMKEAGQSPYSRLGGIFSIQEMTCYTEIPDASMPLMLKIEDKIDYEIIPPSSKDTAFYIRRINDKERFTTLCITEISPESK